MPRVTTVAFACLAMLLWCALAASACYSLYWRDAGEFILASFYLDIAHPAGFPAYAQISNVCALLPGGPIAWRVALFSALASFACLILAWYIVRLLLQHQCAMSKETASLLGLLAPLLMAGVPAFMRQAISVEVYPLNCLFFEVLFLLYYLFRMHDDVRFVLTAAFVAGLGLGNHLSLGAPIAVGVCVLILHARRLLAAAPKVLLLGAAGLLVYAYIPARAHQALPLATGYPATPERIWNLVSTARDRELRTPRTTGEIRTSGVTLPFANLAATLPGDMRSLAHEMGACPLAVALLGVVLLIFNNLRAGVLLTCGSAAVWLFFNGWDPDPWLPVFAGLAILATFAVGASFRHLRLVLAGVLSALSVWAAWLNLPVLRELRDYTLPIRTARNVLSRAPAQAALLTESSWFLLAYARHIEGYRSDVTLVYQPRALFPYYFEPIVLEREPRSAFTTDPLRSIRSSEASLETLGELITFAAQTNAFAVEPNVVINPFLKDVAVLDERGAALLVNGRQGSLAPGYSDALLAVYTPIAVSICGSLPALGNDARNYLDTSLVNAAHLLENGGHIVEALRLYESTCMPFQSACNDRTPSPCSQLSRQNMDRLRGML